MPLRGERLGDGLGRAVGVWLDEFINVAVPNDCTGERLAVLP